MLDFPLMLWVKLPVVDGIYPESNKFATGVENEATGDSKTNDSPGLNLPGLSTIIPTMGCAHHNIVLRLTKLFHDFSALSKPVYPVKSNSVDSGHCYLSVVKQVHAKHSWTGSK